MIGVSIATHIDCFEQAQRTSNPKPELGDFDNSESKSEIKAQALRSEISECMPDLQNYLTSQPIIFKDESWQMCWDFLKHDIHRPKT